MILARTNTERGNQMIKELKKTNNRKLLAVVLIAVLAFSTLGLAYAETNGSDDNTNSSVSSDSSKPEPPTGSSDGPGGPGGTPPSGDPGHKGPGGPGGSTGSNDGPEDHGAPPEKPDGESSGNQNGPGGTPPDGSPGGQNGPGSNSASDIDYSGSTEFTTDTQESGKTYTSANSNEQALLVSGGTSLIENATVNKSGDSDGDESDFYGTNAAVLTTSGTLTILNSDITTDGSHANAVFAYGDGVIKISDSAITTNANNSGAVMVTGGGTLTADNVKAKTSGNSSAPIRSDRGGGTMIINGGSYESNGVGSPVVYSTADVTVNNAVMTSTASEGVVVEGKNSVTLNEVTMTADNNTHNGKSETYKAIFIYQSMSGDAEDGTASFTAKDSEINVLNGDTIFVTNTTAEIYMENNSITNESGDFLRIQSGAWGNEGSNGGTVSAVLSNQRIEGDVIVDSISTLDLTLKDGSKFFGAIDSENQSQQIDLTMSADSVLVLSADTYVDSLTNENAENTNIYLNGHKLFVNGVETTANEGVYEDDEIEQSEAVTEDAAANTADSTAESADQTKNSGTRTLVYAVGGLLLIALASAVIAVSKKKAEEHSHRELIAKLQEEAVGSDLRKEPSEPNDQ